MLYRTPGRPLPVSQLTPVTGTERGAAGAPPKTGTQRVAAFGFKTIVQRWLCVALDSASLS